MNELRAKDLPQADGLELSDVAAQAALGLIEAYCGWPLLLNLFTAQVDCDGSDIAYLPCLNITEVTALSLRLTPSIPLVEDVDWEWSADGTLRRLGGYRWPWGARRLVVTYTGGYDPLPAAVLAVAGSVAERTQEGTAVKARTEQVGGITVTESRGATGAGLTSIEMAALDRWRIAQVR